MSEKLTVSLQSLSYIHIALIYTVKRIKVDILRMFLDYNYSFIFELFRTFRGFFRVVKLVTSKDILTRAWISVLFFGYLFLPNILIPKTVTL